MKKKLGTLIAALFATAAFAQTLGTVTSVNGVATVTTGTAGTAITAGAPIVEGARVITTSTGSVTFRLASGCVINVPPGSAVTVRSALSCQQLQASVQPTTTATTATTTPAGFNIGTPSGAAAAGFAALLAIGIIAAENDDNDNVPISGR